VSDDEETEPDILVLGVPQQDPQVAWDKLRAQTPPPPVSGGGRAY
jgi:hypothetical protein